VEFVGGWVVMQMMENRVGGSESNVDVCMSK
jgi:hypothetical protein